MLKDGGFERYRLSVVLTCVGMLTVMLFAVGVITGSTHAGKFSSEKSAKPIIDPRAGETAYYKMRGGISIENITANEAFDNAVFAEKVQKLRRSFAPRKRVAASAAQEGPTGTGRKFSREERKRGKRFPILYARNSDQSPPENISDAETRLLPEPRRHHFPGGQQLSTDAANGFSSGESDRSVQAPPIANSSVLPSALKRTGDVSEPGAPDSVRPSNPLIGSVGVGGLQTMSPFHLSRELDRIAAEYAKGKAGEEESLSPASVSLDAKQGVFRGDRSSPLAPDSNELRVAKTARDDATGGSVSRRDADSKLSRPHGERDTSGEPADKWNGVIGRKTALAEGGDIYCSVGPAYTGPLPPSLCSYYLVYNSVQYHSSNKSLHVASAGSWQALVKSANDTHGPRVLLTLAAAEVKSVVADFLLPTQFATMARSFLEDRKLAGLTFDLSLAADYDLGSYSMLLKVTKENLPGYHLVGLIDFVTAKKLVQTNLAELVRSADKVFLHNDARHVHISATSVPNPFTSSNEHVYSVENAVKLAQGLRLASTANNVCLTLSLAVFKFETSDRGADRSPPSLGTLATEVDVAFPYSKLCKAYRGHHTHYDEETLSAYVHSRNSWLGFDDDASMGTKVDWLIRKKRVGCFLVENVDLDDPTNVCKTGDFRRLRLIKQALEGGEHA